jgi:hypothetical protein
MVHIEPDCNAIAAHHIDAVKKVHSIGRQVARKAERLIETVPAHRTGLSRVNYYEGTVDSVIELDDSRDERAAAAIEYGTKRSRGIYILKKATNGVG